MPVIFTDSRFIVMKANGPQENTGLEEVFTVQSEALAHCWHLDKLENRNKQLKWLAQYWQSGVELFCGVFRLCTSLGYRRGLSWSTSSVIIHSWLQKILNTNYSPLLDKWIWDSYSIIQWSANSHSACLLFPLIRRLMLPTHSICQLWKRDIPFRNSSLHLGQGCP